MVSSAAMPGMLPTATLRYAVCILPHITAHVLRRPVTSVSAHSSASLCARAGEVHCQCFASVSQLTSHTTLRRSKGRASSSSAVVPGTLPTARRFAPMAGSPSPPLSFCRGRWHQAVGKALVRHAKPWGVCSLAPRAELLFAAPAAHARYGHPLRFYIRPHCMKCAPVVALKLHLVSPTAGAPCGLTQQALCKVACAGAGVQPSALPGQCLPYASPSERPGGCCGAVALVRCFASVSVGGLRPVTTS